MNHSEKTLSPLDALKWYNAMDIDSVVSLDENRWKAPVKTITAAAYEDKDLKALVASSPMKTQISTSTISTSPQEQASNNLSRMIADRATSLEELKSALLTFDGCDLKQTANNTVFSDGIATSKIMLIGEAPGASEDAQGIPFCGESGKLLDNMIASIGLSRKENVYITNTIFWRPPANRRPTEEEVDICRPFVEKHIALIKPDLLILVGATAVSGLLGNHLQISKIRQEYYQYKNMYLDKPITTTALFHPAYLLRQPFQKKATWYDLLKIQEFITHI